MKFTVDIEATPEEARKFLGLPDVSPMQDRLLDQMEEQIARNLKAMDPEAALRAALPAAGQGIEQFQQLINGLLQRRNRKADGDEE